MIILRNNAYFKKWAIVNFYWESRNGISFIICFLWLKIWYWKTFLFLQIDKVHNILGNDWQEITVNPTHILTSIFASSCAEDYVCKKKSNFIWRIILPSTFLGSKLELQGEEYFKSIHNIIKKSSVEAAQTPNVNQSSLIIKYIIRQLMSAYNYSNLDSIKNMKKLELL